MLYLMIAFIAGGVSLFSAVSGANDNWFWPGLIAISAVLLGLFDDGWHRP